MRICALGKGISSPSTLILFVPVIFVLYTPFLCSCRGIGFSSSGFETSELITLFSPTGVV